MARNSTLVVTLALCIMIAAPLAIEAAFPCGQVSTKLAPCINYLTGKGALTPGCCNGVSSLNSQARTSADRKAACNCLKSAAGAIRGINYGTAGGLPGACGISIPYAISPNTNCNNVN